MPFKPQPQRSRKTSEVFLLLLIAITLLTACSKQPQINGRWRSAPPSSLLYEYKDDGTVFLFQDGRSYQVFRYQLLDDDTIRLYDGMGRIQEYTFRLSADQLTFYTDLAGAEIAESFQRIENRPIVE